MTLDNPFNVSKERVTETVKQMSNLMNCDYKTAYDKYTHELVKMCASWKEIEPLLSK